MARNDEGVAMLKLECPQTHPVGRILKDAPHQPVQFDSSATAQTATPPYV